ncbi:MAG: hypothetical protein KGH80_08000, partial [Xanthomonadaceae bacterium]|nr:hypothetical protein [Xanthomonadaceae bacterium]
INKLPHMESSPAFPRDDDARNLPSLCRSFPSPHACQSGKERIFRPEPRNDEILIRRPPKAAINAAQNAFSHRIATRSVH